MSMNNISLIDPEQNEVSISPSQEWQKIIDSLLDQLDLEDVSNHSKVLNVVKDLISGFPMIEVSERNGVSTKTIRTWLVKYPNITVVVKQGQDALVRWRMSLLEKQFLDAAEFSAMLLSNNKLVTGRNDKVLAQQAKQARYIIDLFTGKFRDLHITQVNNTVAVDTVNLQGTKNALDYVAQQLNNIGEDEIIDGEYKVSFTNGPKNEPLLDEDGTPFYGDFGSISVTEEGIECHICGARVSKLQPHLSSSHGVTPREYENTFNLIANGIKNAEQRYIEIRKGS